MKMMKKSAEIRKKRITSSLHIINPAMAGRTEKRKSKVASNSVKQDTMRYRIEKEGEDNSQRRTREDK